MHLPWNSAIILTFDVCHVLDIGSAAAAPVWGFGVFILQARANNSTTLNNGIAFAALSLFELLNQPLTFAIMGFEEVQIVINSFQRIQKYLLSDEREDKRTLLGEIAHCSTPKQTFTKDTMEATNEISSAEKKENFLNPICSTCETVVIASNVTASYKSEESPVLDNISFRVSRGQTTMVFGPVGCGKSTLLKLILGELPYTLGSITVNFTNAAYCPQSPWTTYGTVQSNIVGMSCWDKSWYDTVIHACGLSSDFAVLENGDQTSTGSSGSRLSGGQQLRVVSKRFLFLGKLLALKKH